MKNKTVRRLAAGFLGWALAAAPGLAWAQVQPIPVYGANSGAVSYAVRAEAGGLTKTEYFYGDYSQFSEIDIRATYSTAGFDCAASGNVIAVMGGKQTSYNYDYVLRSAHSYMLIAWNPVLPTVYRYRVAASDPVTIMVQVVSALAQPCQLTVEVRGVVFPAGGAVRGEVNVSLNPNIYGQDMRPVLTGGVYKVTASELYAKSTAVDSLGQTKVVGPVAAGVAPTGDPVLVGGLDNGTGLTQTLSVDSTGALKTASTPMSEVTDGANPPAGYKPNAIAGIDRTGGKMWTASVDATGAIKTSGGTISFAPGVPSKVTLAASTSASLCGLTAGADYEVSCSVATAWRHGAATPTATVDDNQIPAGVIRSPVRMPTGSTCFAFISASAGACFVSAIPTT